MSLKQTEHILEILRKSGSLPAIAIKERVLVRMNISDTEYPKSTFQGHLEKLCDEKKIEYKTENGKRIYSIPNFDHPVLGGLILENAGGRIDVPELLAGFEVTITEDLIQKNLKEQILLIFQFNSKTIYINIPKKALPFSIHISRKKFVDDISKNVRKEFGSRTITLELPIIQLSSFQLDSIPENTKKGHALISFDDKVASITELGATNPSELAQIKNLSIESFLEEISLFSNYTIDAKFEKRSSKISGKTPLLAGTSQMLSIPSLILLCSDAQLGIF